MDYNVVYHVATLNHWEQVVREQIPLLADNRGWNSLTVSIGSDTDAEVGQAVELVRQLVGGSKVRFYRFALRMFEHDGDGPG